MTRTACSLLFFFLVLVPAGALAQVRPETQATTIRIRHAPSPARVVVTPGRAGFNPELLRNSQRFFLRRSDVAIVGIQDPNPLLYEYSLGSVVKTPTEDFTALVEFTKLLATVPGLVSAAGEKMAGTSELVLVSGAKQEDLTPRLRTGKKLADLGVTKELLGEFSEKFAKALAHADRVPDWIKRSEGNPAGVKEEVAQQNIDVLVADLTRVTGVILKALQQVSKDLQDSDIAESTAVIPLLVVSSQSDSITKVLALLKSFDAAAKAINVTFDFPTEIGFSNTDRQTVQLTVKRKAGGDPSVFEFVFEPERVLAYGFGGAAVWSFVAKDDGKDVGQKTVPMLTVGSPRWQDSNIHLQFGVLPDKNQVGVFAGLGLKIEKALAISVGWTWQDLDPGTPRAIKGAVYLGASLIKEK